MVCQEQTERINIMKKKVLGLEKKLRKVVMKGLNAYGDSYMTNPYSL
jgi:hypothetical protein